MHKVQLMTQDPPKCLHCGRGNLPDDPDSIDEFWALDLERDINWGDPTYLCKYCCEQIAATAGFVTMEDLAEQQNINEHLHGQLHDLKAKLEERERRLKQIVRGKKAIRQTRAEATTTKKKKAVA